MTISVEKSQGFGGTPIYGHTHADMMSSTCFPPIGGQQCQDHPIFDGFFNKGLLFAARQFNERMATGCSRLTT